MKCFIVKVSGGKEVVALYMSEWIEISIVYELDKRYECCTLYGVSGLKFAGEEGGNLDDVALYMRKSTSWSS